jgi:O-antigen/teichoic acid export membrane protein
VAILSVEAVRKRAGPEVYGAAKAAGLLTVAGLATGLSNLIFNVVAARASGAERYGGIGTLLALISVASYLGIATTYAVARRTAIHELDPRFILRGAARTMVPWFACLLPVLIAIGPISDFLQLPSALPTGLAVCTVLVMLVGSLANGILVGCRRFRLVAALNIGAAVTRVLLGLVLPGIFDATDAALVATLIPIALVCVTAILLVLRIGAFERTATAMPTAAARENASRGLPRESIAGAFGAMALWAVWAAPLVGARHGLSTADSGRFAAAQVLASAVLYVVAPVTVAFFPTISKHRDSKALMIGMLLSGLLAVTGATALALFGPLFMTTVYGAQFATTRGLFLELGLSAMCVAVATFALWALRARHGRAFGVTVIAVVALALEAAAWAWWSPRAGVLAVGPSAALLVATALTLLLFAGFRRRLPTVLRRSATAQIEWVDGVTPDAG